MAERFDAVSSFCGKYAGEGTWVDIVGESKRYRVAQEISIEPTGLLVKYTHEFFQEGTSSEGEFRFEFTSESILATKMKGAAVGNGYVFDDYLHFNLKVGEIFVETSYQLREKSIQVRGSSTSNAQGRFIAWSEMLVLAQ